MAQPTPGTGTTPAVKPVSQLKTAEDLQRKLDSLRRGRQTLEQQWKLNLAFYKGRQYTYFNRYSGRVESRPVDDGEKPRYMVRLVSNQILSGSQSLLSKFTKTKPQFSATPGSSSDQDFKAAEMAERLLEYWWSEFDLDTKLEEALLWSIVAGQGYWKLSWDAHANKAMRFMLDPQGNPITDDNLKDIFRGQLKQMGVEPQEKVVYLGDIRVEVMSPFDVYLDSSAKGFDDSKYVICAHHLDPDEIKTRWGATVQPNAIPSPSDATLPFGKTLETEPTVATVYVGYFKPSPSLPNGRYVAWTSDREKKILQDDPWPYPFQELPIVKFPGLTVPGSPYDSSVVEHAIPLQKELNRTISQIVEHKNLTMKPQVMAPEGSIRTRLTGEPGLVVEFQPYGDHKPEWRDIPAIPPYVFEHLAGIRNGLNDVFGIADVTEGKVPPNVEAGIAIDLLQEMATDRLAPTIKLIEHSLAGAGQRMLSLAQTYYIEPRLIKIKGSSGATQVERFTQADIAGGISIDVESGSALPRTRAGRQARILNYVQLGIVPPDKAYKYLDMADLKGLSKRWTADEEMAQREQDKIVRGEPLNMTALNDARQAIMQGINPDTGQPLQSPDEAEQIMNNAALKPFIFEDYDTHLDQHRIWMASPEFFNLPLEQQQAAITHYTLTIDARMQLPPMPDAQAPRVNLQLKGTVGPTGAAEILNKAGVFAVTPEVMTEPPLETWVSDSVDKPDVETEGNVTMDNIQQTQQISQSDALHQQKMLQESAKTEAAHAQTDKAQLQAMSAAESLRQKRIGTNSGR